MREYGELMLVELRKVIPAFLKRVDVDGAWRGVDRVLARDARATCGGRGQGAGGESSPSRAPEVTLVDWDPDGEVKVVAAALYGESDLPDDRCWHRARDDARTSGRRAGARRRRPGEPPAQAGPRLGAHRVPVRRVCDYGAFRDLQRHRLLTIEWQRLTTEHGYEIPPRSTRPACARSGAP